MTTKRPNLSSVNVLTFRSTKRARDMFIGDATKPDFGVSGDDDSRQRKIKYMVSSEFGEVLDMPIAVTKKPAAEPAMLALTSASKLVTKDEPGSAANPALATSGTNNTQLALVKQVANDKALAVRAPTMPKPKWHPKWKLMRVISGHQGWVRAITVDPSNEWFVTGSQDRTIKIWDLARGTLKLTLTGHVSTVRGLAVSDRHPYLFSCAEDKQVKCWDLEVNKVIRHYHGHLSACYGLALHPTLNVLYTCGRDSTVRVWDMRTKSQVHCLTGHTNTVSSIIARGTDPQVISGSHDSTIRLWDLRQGKSICSLTNHKKSVRALTLHPRENTFTSASPDNIKQWYLPEGKFIQNLSGHNAVINSLVCNNEGVLVSGADNGSLNFWDYRTGHRFQQLETTVQSGSLDSEAGIFAMCYDKSGSRLLTAEADKTIKEYKEDEKSTEETDPVDWKPGIVGKARF